MAAELVEQLAARVRTLLERLRKGRNPLVVVDELLFVDQRVVDAIDALGRQRPVVAAGRTEKVPPPARLVQVVIEVGAGRDQAVHVALGEQVRQHQAQAARAERAGDAQEDQHVVGQHPTPHLVGRGKAAALERDAFHAAQDLLGRQPGLHDERLHRNVEQPGLA